MLTIEGFQVPVIPFVEVVGKLGAVVFAQNGAIALNVGNTFGFTTISKLIVVAQTPVVGVKVYIPEVVLSTVDGFHVPLMPLFEVVGKIGAVAFAHKLVITVKLGVTFGVTVIDRVTGVAH